MECDIVPNVFESAWEKNMYPCAGSYEDVLQNFCWEVLPTLKKESKEFVRKRLGGRVESRSRVAMVLQSEAGKLSNLFARVDEVVPVEDVPLVIDQVAIGVAGVMIVLSRLADYHSVDLDVLTQRAFCETDPPSDFEECRYDPLPGYAKA